MGPVVPAGTRLLLDTVALVYFLESHPRYSKTAEAIFRRIESNDIQGVISSLVLTELLVSLYRAGEERAAIGLTNQLLNFANLEVIDVSADIAVEAAQIRARYGLRAPDAIHCATAAVCEVSGILTNDKQWLIFREHGIEVWLFDELLDSLG